MHVNALEEHTTQKNPHTLPPALIARASVCRISYALTVDFMQDAPSFMQEKIPKLRISTPRIGIDLMGGETDPHRLIDEVIPFLEKQKDRVFCTLFCTAPYAKKIPSWIETHIAENVILMTDPPLLAVRRKKKASLTLGIDALKTGHINAFISMGNTGALIASATTKLPLLPGIDKSALLARLPTKKNDLAVLDVGAHVNCKAIHLAQFASMGIAYQKARGIEEPKVGLLNIGTEEKKGTKEHIEAYARLTHLPNFVGNIEGRDAFQGNVDVLVTDGFTGNIFLKTAEGIAACILEQLEIKAPALAQELKTRLHYGEHPGALIVGLPGIVMKCHGNSPPGALISSITSVLQLIENNFLENIQDFYQKR